jgi:hypothetical protein
VLPITNELLNTNDRRQGLRASGDTMPGISAMTESNTIRPRRDADEQEVSLEYRPVSVWAIVVLVLGLLSATAFVHPLLWLIPPLGVVSGLLTLRRIRTQEPRPFGRSMALAGVALSVFFGVAAGAHLWSYRYLGQIEARYTAQQWFEYLRQGEPQKADQLCENPLTRPPLDDGLWGFYRTHQDAREGLRKFVANPLVRTLLALGKKAQARPYAHGSFTVDGNSELAEEVFAVTFEDQGLKKSFFAVVTLESVPPDGSRRPRWCVVGYRGGIKPQAFTASAP